jgi:hypothetical protein
MSTQSERNSPPGQTTQAYSGSRIERAAQFRDHEDKLAVLAQDQRAAIYVISGELIVLKSRGEELDPLFSLAQAQTLGQLHETIFLGLLDGAPRFGAGLEAAAVEALKARADLKLIDLRTIAVQGAVATEHVPPLAEAKAVLGWHARHRFCPNCGAATRLTQGGWRRDCPVCKAEHFPRTDPVVIMLPVAAFSADHVVVPCRFLRARRIDRGGGPPRSRRGSRRYLLAGHLLCLAALAVSVIADDRLSCTGGDRRDRYR